VSVQEGAKKFGFQVAAMVTSGVIVFYLTRKGALSDLIFGNFQSVEFVEYVLVFLSLILTLAAVAGTYVIRSSEYEESSEQQDAERDFHSAEVITDLGEVEEQEVLITGCIKYNGVNHTAHLLESGEIEIENVRCPECNTRLAEEQEGGSVSFPDKLQERIESERSKEEIPTKEPRRALVCPNPHCDFFVVKDVDRPSMYYLESIFDRHFRKIKSQADLSIKSLKQDYRKRTGESNPGPYEIWHEYNLRTDAEEVCSEIETGNGG